MCHAKSSPFVLFASDGCTAKLYTAKCYKYGKKPILNSGYSLAMLIFHLYHTSHSVGIVVPDFSDFRELNFCITILNNVWLIPAAPSRPHRPIAQRLRRSSTCKSHKRKTAGNCSPQATRTNGIHNLQCVVRWFCD